MVDYEKDTTNHHARVGGEGTVVDADDNYVKGQDVVISKPNGLRGDINASGNVDIDDLNICINIILGKAFETEYPGKADVDDSGTVDIDDLNIVINIILGKE